jgi:hypothetical protein
VGDTVCLLGMAWWREWSVWSGLARQHQRLGADLHVVGLAESVMLAHAWWREWGVLSGLAHQHQRLGADLHAALGELPQVSNTDTRVCAHRSSNARYLEKMSTQELKLPPRV